EERPRPPAVHDAELVGPRLDPLPAAPAGALRALVPVPPPPVEDGVQVADASSTTQSPSPARLDGPDSRDDVALEALGLSVRAYNCLRRAGITGLTDLTTRHESELQAIPNLGSGTLREVYDVLASRGLGLSDELGPPLDPPARPP